jgi:hypothetical protein
MRAIYRGAGLAALGLCLAGLSGCQEDNNATAKLEGVKPTVGKDGQPLPSSPKEQYLQTKPMQTSGPGQNPYGQGYPGSR